MQEDKLSRDERIRLEARSPRRSLPAGQPPDAPRPAATSCAGRGSSRTTSSPERCPA